MPAEFYLAFGTFSAAAVALFAVIPAPMLTALAGVALLGALQGASGIAPWGVVSRFWGCLAGVGVYVLAGRRRKA